MTEQKITPCLWFDFNAEEAVEFPVTFGDFVQLYETKPAA